MMLDPEHFLRLLGENNVSFFTGVPDSLLKEICACISARVAAEQHIIAANEGAAVGLAIGHHLATGETPLIYMQNSGLGNAVNPLLSLASREVYGVPMLVMIGWRGEPGVKDEPQHVHQGRVMQDMIESMDFPAYILSTNSETVGAQLQKAAATASRLSSPVFLIVKKGTFAKFAAPKITSDLTLGREEAIITCAKLAGPQAAIVATTGMPSRELFEHRAMSQEGHNRDFLTVGGMGHASQIATGIALSKPQRRVYCFDGDGATLMHMGSLAITGQRGLDNLVHVVFNNGAHASVGGQPTVGLDVDFCQIALACGYRQAFSVTDLAGIHDTFAGITDAGGPIFIEIKVRPENRKDIARPTKTPFENKHDLMAFLKGD